MRQLISAFPRSWELGLSQPDPSHAACERRCKLSALTELDCRRAGTWEGRTGLSMLNYTAGTMFSA